MIENTYILSKEVLLSSPIHTFENLLKSENGNLTELFFLTLRNSEFLESFQRQEIITLFGRLFRVLSPETNMISFKSLIAKVKEKNPHSKKIYQEDYEKILLEAYKDNPKFITNYLLNNYWTLHPTLIHLQHLQSEEEEKLSAFEISLVQGYKKVAQILFQEGLSLKHTTPQGNGLFSIIFSKGQWEEIRLLFEKYIKSSGKERLQQTIYEESYVITCHLLNKDKEYVKSFFVHLQEYGIDLTSSIFSGTEKSDYLVHCRDPEILKMMIEILPSIKRKEALVLRGSNILKNSLELSTEQFVNLVNYLKQNAVPLSPLFSHKSKQEEQTTIGWACLLGRAEHLEVMLKHLDDQDLEKILNEPFNGSKSLLEFYLNHNEEKCAGPILKAKASLIKKQSTSYSP
ncbi:MAG: hypothetical protein Tsb0021_07670 [Chlamydiales bacterium]